MTSQPEKCQSPVAEITERSAWPVLYSTIRHNIEPVLSTPSFLNLNIIHIILLSLSSERLQTASPLKACVHRLRPPA